MPDREPIKTTNLDIYSSDAVPWSLAHAKLSNDSSEDGATHFVFLGTVGPDGSPYVAGVGAAWHDGDLYFTSNLDRKKARNLASNPACTIAAQLNGIDITCRGTAEQAGDDRETLERIAEIFRNTGWPAEVAEDAPALTAPYSAQSAGPPPWYVYRFTFDSVVGIKTEEPFGASRWDFAR